MAHRLKFAVVREDPAVEAELVRRARARSILLVASGGCTALTLKHEFPRLDVTAFDFNPVQLAHVRTKALAVERGDAALLNDLNQRGDFEGLFRLLRAALLEFVLTTDELEAFFSSASHEERRRMVARWQASPYWAAAFSVAFADGLLNAMFGPAATQHAAPSSYPGYFQRAFERGLLRADAASNPYLQHPLLGNYREDDAPSYLHVRSPLPVTLLPGTLLDMPDLSAFDIISLSNIFDWSDDALVQSWSEVILRQTRPGAMILMRQLNNQRNLRRFFEPAFAFDDSLGAALWEQDRSLFYERFEVGTRTS